MMTSRGPKTSAEPTNILWLVFALASATSFLLYLHRYTWGFVKVAVAEEFAWRDDILGWLDSAFMISYAGGQIPGRMLGDWFGPQMALGIMILVWSLSMGGDGTGRRLSGDGLGADVFRPRLPAPVSEQSAHSSVGQPG
jgi:sugar phosphate permease